MNRVFQNCMKYNKRGTVIHCRAQNLESMLYVLKNQMQRQLDEAEE